MTRILALLCCALLLAACNDKATGIGSEIIPGTDTLFPATSSVDSLITSAITTQKRESMFNNTYALLGKTADSDARMFVEFINWPTFFRDTAPVRVISTEMIMVPAPYVYGDTVDKRLTFSIYELQQTWGPSVTWDSIWNADGSSAYYSTAQPTIGTFDRSITMADSAGFTTLLDTALIHRWLVLASDTATRTQIKGMVLHPTAGNTIQQIRALDSKNIPLTILRLVYQHRDSATPDTINVQSTVACFVNTPIPATGALVVQGAYIHQSQLVINLASLRPSALIMSAALRLSLDDASTIVGNTGITEVLRLNYTTFQGGAQNYFARYDSTEKHYLFVNLAPALQDMARHQVKGTFVIRPDGVDEFWRMTRVSFKPWSSDTATRPRLSVIYSIPKVIR